MNKFCKDCKWMQHKWFTDKYRCFHPEVIETNIDWVLGKVELRGFECDGQRNLSYGKCGVEGKLWEANP